MVGPPCIDYYLLVPVSRKENLVTIQPGTSHSHQDTAFALVDPEGECKAVLPRGTSANDARTMAKVMKLKLVLAEVKVTMTFIQPVESKSHRTSYVFIPDGFGE